MKFTIDSTTDQVQSTGGIALAAKISACNVNLLNLATISPVEAGGRKYIPVDVDVSPLDNSGSHKEGVRRTYKRHDGFAPIFSYIGAEDICSIQNFGKRSSIVKETPLNIWPEM